MVVRRVISEQRQCAYRVIAEQRVSPYRVLTGEHVGDSAIIRRGTAAWDALAAMLGVGGADVRAPASLAAAAALAPVAVSEARAAAAFAGDCGYSAVGVASGISDAAFAGAGSWAPVGAVEARAAAAFGASAGLTATAATEARSDATLAGAGAVVGTTAAEARSDAAMDGAATLAGVGEAATSGPDLTRSWLGDGSTAYWTADDAAATFANLCSSTSGTFAFWCRHSALSGDSYIAILATTSGYAPAYVQSTARLQASVISGLIEPSAHALDTWHHYVVALRPGSTSVLYRDGVSVDTSTGSTSARTYTKFTVGAFRTGSVFGWWPGHILDMAASDYQWTAGDASLAYNAGVPADPTTLGLSGAIEYYWPFGEAYDSGGGVIVVDNFGSAGVMALTGVNLDLSDIVAEAP